MAAFGDSFSVYPWNSTAAATTVQYQWGSSSGGYTVQPYYYPPAPVTPAVEMPEGPMEWLQRRVTEITDLAYAA